MMPDRCSVAEQGRRCPNPPEFVVSVTSGKDEYMIGVTCGRHREIVLAKAAAMQKDGGIPEGAVAASPLKSVGTDCIKGDPDDLIQIG